MAIELEKIALSGAKGRPNVEVIFGHTHVGQYRAFLWDAQAKNPVEVGHGNNVDSIIDTFEIQTDAADLDQCILSFEALIQPAEVAPGQAYSLTLMVRQEGQLVEGGIVQETGTFNGAKAIIQFRRFTVTA